jgi:inosine-uridine nucleoside N-ribohydrolase
VLDCDTGTDDAVAIMLALSHPALEVVGITTVAGNHDVAATTDNTLRVLTHIGRSDVPVHAGLDRAFGDLSDAHARRRAELRSRRSMRRFPLPPSLSAPAEPHAVDWLVDTLRAATQRLTLVATAPLSNIAAAVTADPSIVEPVDEIVIMGGASGSGSITASAETNMWHDPIAAQTVLDAGFRRLVLIPLDATLRALVSIADCGRLRALATPAAMLAADLIESRIIDHEAWRRPGEMPAAPVHDALAVAYLLTPEVVTLRALHVAVETGGALTAGRTVMDMRPTDAPAANAQVALDADASVFADVLATALGRVRSDPT